jgi:hypothetical protein
VLRVHIEGEELLPCPVPKTGNFVRMGVGGIRNTKMSLHAIDCIEKDAPLDLGDFTVKPIEASNLAGDTGGYHLIKTRCGIIAKLDVEIIGSKGVVYLEDFNYN